MKRERRSYYRILYVQPEAPQEIIRAAYRSLMTKLKMHPDLGGDHDTAVAINQAYDVLSDPAKRRAYDAARKGGHRPAAAPFSATAQAAPARPGCAFCGHALPRVIAHDSQCQRCGSPLGSVAAHPEGGKDPAGRRRAMRVSKKDAASVQTAWNRQASTARLRDFSTTGVSFYTAAPIGIDSNVRLRTPLVDLVARVIQVRCQDRINLVHGKILAARYIGQSGVFVSVAV